jgi:hypothetical protein
MMHKLSLKFDGIKETINIVLDSSKNAEFFVNYLKSFNRPADSVSVHQPIDQQLENFLNAARQAKELFNFDWELTQLTKENFNHWHRDIETFDLSLYPPYTEEKGKFFVDLHSKLHLVENRIVENIKEFDFIRPSCSIKWFAPSVPWPEIPKFTPRLAVRTGDIIMDFPHVGKSPWTSFQNNDVENLIQSCKLPNMCAPGFVISLTENYFLEPDKNKLIQQQRQQLIDWYQANVDTLSKMFSQEEMLTYDGEYCIGRLENPEQLELFQAANLKSVLIV